MVTFSTFPWSCFTTIALRLGYNYVIFFFQIPSLMPSALFQIHGLFSPTNCCYIHILHLHRSINTTCSVHIILVACLSRLIIWQWINSSCAPPLGRLFLLLSAFLGCHGSSCRAGTPWAFPCLLLLFLSRQPCWWAFICYTGSGIARRQNLTASCLILWLSQSLCTSKSLPSLPVSPIPL